MGYQNAEGPILWVQDLNASTSTTVFPSGASAGVAKENATTGVPAGGVTPMRGSNRIYLAVDYADTVGATSCSIHLYGYADRGAFAASPRWLWCGAMNRGLPIAGTTANGLQAPLRVLSTEPINISCDNFSRYATRSLVPAGTAPTISTFIGFPLE